jgi:hypothetical protein
VIWSSQSMITALYLGMQWIVAGSAALVTGHAQHAELADQITEDRPTIRNNQATTIMTRPRRFRPAIARMCSPGSSVLGHGTFAKDLH